MLLSVEVALINWHNMRSHTGIGDHSLPAIFHVHGLMRTHTFPAHMHSLPHIMCATCFPTCNVDAAYGTSWRTAVAVGVTMAHVGEFAFILLSMGWQLGILSPQVRGHGLRLVWCCMPVTNLLWCLPLPLRVTAAL